jgi:hypothetical protein
MDFVIYEFVCYRSLWIPRSSYRFVGGSWLVVGTGFVGEEGVSAPRELLLELDLRGWPKEVRREKFTPAGSTVARVARVVVSRKMGRWGHCREP